MIEPGGSLGPDLRDAGEASRLAIDLRGVEVAGIVAVFPPTAREERISNSAKVDKRTSSTTPVCISAAASAICNRGPEKAFDVTLDPKAGSPNSTSTWHWAQTKPSG